jgi:hypothetical protein
MKKVKRKQALARRPPAWRSVSLVVRDPSHRLPQVLPASPAALVREPIMIPSFVGTLKLSAEQIAELRRPVRDDEIEWKPAVKDGPPVIPYLSHNGYRDRLDAAFGLGGWGMVPVGMPVEKDTSIFTPYALVVDGIPRVYAWGEQELHKMSYGDGLEGAKSNAIVRCGKELGIARELWNRSFIAELKRRTLQRGQQQDQAAGPRNSEPAAPHYDANHDAVITEPQQKRFFAIAKKAGRTKPELAVWLAAAYNISASANIKRRDYNTIISQVERRGPLPMPETEPA